MGDKTLRVSLVGSAEYGKVYQQALMTTLKAQTEGASKIEIVHAGAAEDALFKLVQDIAKTVDLSVDFGGLVATVVSWKALSRAMDILGGIDGIQKRSAETKVSGDA